ncbi:MAG: TetR/AcrR family transcriptional regulator [Bacteroidota bacterium]|jgi:AcrR family transcriptional regulator|uniref:TetR/AcrR family transcriptional regulator n=2 Tax=Flagellimonas TaxID=444459 RepID=A0A6G7IZD5_9FLAO|nr:MULTISPECIES: TetR/AcrR family transcriptional regulator [Allomuricauda]MBW8245202.1 TetR/AcrR family transcriptional regulator [Allomuricauda oceani]MDF0708788.1 TetR/AcrR family transcriptional regulator [[Muricauda] okinawensis]MEC8832044.1 TetR/AcrR family transcriptional regulator [Bacteroidota bacterium]QII43607.1 TetR/AcrR family transcriptional regulator [Allomuricauda oceani]
MISKSELIACSALNFTRFGSKRFTLDELANQLGISKKTIYHYFNKKEELVQESTAYLLLSYSREIQGPEIALCKDPLEKIILIYKKGFEHLKYFSPTFLFGLRKYYPKAYELFNGFRNDLVNETIYELFVDAQKLGCVQNEVNLRLVCELYFLNLNAIAFGRSSLFDKYTQQEILQHLIINTIKGIVTKDYTNRFIQK